MSLAIGDAHQGWQQSAHGHVELADLLRHCRQVFPDGGAVARSLVARIVQAGIDRIGMPEGAPAFRQQVERRGWRIHRVDRVHNPATRPDQPNRSRGTAAAANRTAAMRIRVKGSLSQKMAMRTAKMALVSRSAAAGAIGAHVVWPARRRAMASACSGTDR